MNVEITDYSHEGNIETLITITFENGFVYRKFKHPDLSLGDYVSDAEFANEHTKRQNIEGKTYFLL